MFVCHCSQHRARRSPVDVQGTLLLRRCAPGCPCHALLTLLWPHPTTWVILHSIRCLKGELTCDLSPHADQLLFQIVGGRLYIEFKTSNKKMTDVKEREYDGWFPGNEGPGAHPAMGLFREFPTIFERKRVPNFKSGSTKGCFSSKEDPGAEFSMVKLPEQKAEGARGQGAGLERLVSRQ